MTDLAKGIIEFEEMTLTSQTTKQEFDKKFAEVISPVSNQQLVYLLKLSTVDNTRFGASFVFNSKGKLSSLKLTPYIQYKSEKWDRIGMQEERRRFCGKWLLERLGEPHKVINGDIEYLYQSHTISCFSNFDIRDGGNAGYIVIAYK